MTDLQEQIKKEPEFGIKKESKHDPKSINVAMAEYASSPTLNPWLAKIDSKESDLQKEYLTLVDECRFFYKTDPIVSTVLNKLVEIGINDLMFSKNGLSDNEFRVFTALKPRLLEFAEDMALEFLLSGLVVPEVSHSKIKKEEIFSYGIKKYDSLTVPSSMFLRDPHTIKIDVSMMSDKPSYYVAIPDDTAYFIKNKGRYPNGDMDENLYKLMKVYFPEFVKAVEKGETEILLENDNVIRRRALSDNQYPIPYVAASLDALKHKRQFRRMDYSIADKVIGAIMHVKVGSDDFPITDSEEDVSFVNSLRQQLNWRFNSKKDLERIFQLLTSHIVNIEWIFPDTASLLNDSKYQDINQEILYGLGFPNILITGEALRSATSDAEIAILGPTKTMDSFRRKIIEVIRDICRDVALNNGFKNPPIVNFTQVNLHKFGEFVTALEKLYNTGGLSREAFDEFLGYDFQDQISKRIIEQKTIDDAGIPQIGVSPFAGNQAQQPNSANPEAKPTDTNRDKTTETKPTSGDKTQ